MDRLPGESRMDHGAHILKATCLIAVSIANAFSKCTPEQNQEVRIAIQGWEAEMAKKADDATYVPALRDHKLSSMESQFGSEIDQCVDEYFMCRRKDCMRVGLNTCWSHNAPTTSPKVGGRGALQMPSVRVPVPAMEGQ